MHAALDDMQGQTERIISGCKWLERVEEKFKKENIRVGLQVIILRTDSSWLSSQLLVLSNTQSKTIINDKEKQEITTLEKLKQRLFGFFN